MSDLVKLLISEVKVEANRMANDLGGYASATGLKDLVKHWTTQDVKPDDLINDFDSMLEELVNARIRLGIAVENKSHDLDDYEEAVKPAKIIMDFIKNSWKLD